MGKRDTRGTASKAWEHFKETGVILPGHYNEISARLAEAQREVER